MPTGYTYKVGEQDLSFEEFVWSCARAMTPFIHMRDDSSNAEIRMPTKSSYHAEGLVKAQQELTELHKMSLEAAAALSLSEWESTQKTAREGIEKRNVMLNRYNKMLDQVKAWTPPTSDHDGMKRFMIEQLEDSIKFDCGGSYYQEMLDKPKLSPEEWLKNKIDDAKHDCKYHAEHLKNDEEHFDQNIKWINELMKSVPLPR